MEQVNHLTRGELTLTDRELAERLGALLMLLCGWYVIGMRFSVGGKALSVSSAVNVILGVFLYNAAFAFLVHIVRAKGRINRRLIVELALGQIICDMIAICAVAHYT